jgi:hypothetical protein
LAGLFSVSLKAEFSKRRAGKFEIHGAPMPEDIRSLLPHSLRSGGRPQLEEDCHLVVPLF